VCLCVCVGQGMLAMVSDDPEIQALLQKKDLLKSVVSMLAEWNEPEMQVGWLVGWLVVALLRTHSARLGCSLR
jgi:hypothetical protein